MQYWVQKRGEILGPFDLEELKRLAAQRKVRPDDKVSIDQHQWMIAARVPGLMQIQQVANDAPAPEDEAKQFRAVAIDEQQAADDEYQLSPEEPPRRTEIEPPSEPKKQELPIGVRRMVEVPQQQLGMAVGGVLAVAIIGFAFPVSLAVDGAVGGRIESLGTIMFAIAVLFGLGLAIMAIAGTSSTFEIEVAAKDSARVTLARRFAFITWSRWQSHVDADDQLESRIKQKPGLFTDATFADIALFALLLLCCGLPGALIWIYGIRGGASEENMVDFRLLLRTRESPIPAQLYRERTAESFVTRFGAPSPAEKMIKLLQAAIPELEVSQVEE